MVNLKKIDAIDWTSDNHNTYVAQYLKKQRQPDNESWPVNKI